ncbi:hypothetical protein EVG20_g7500 [Dentipellis fragilis]|uniref:Uncharacterized protein n=1 Tax=Dentipellis fragilis TaxID=205917 RepID=A0A4Y9YH10_9AGAM|nr:hypothetical protein EVG20_g7500 [Dentipellis fragilis]
MSSLSSGRVGLKVKSAQPYHEPGVSMSPVGLFHSQTRAQGSDLCRPTRNGDANPLISRDTSSQTSSPTRYRHLLALANTKRTTLAILDTKFLPARPPEPAATHIRGLSARNAGSCENIARGSVAFESPFRGGEELVHHSIMRHRSRAEYEDRDYQKGAASPMFS